MATVFWTILIALLSIILCLMAGGLSALQSATIMSALPLYFDYVTGLLGLKSTAFDVTKMHCLQDARITPRAIQNPRSWQQRLGLITCIIHIPSLRLKISLVSKYNMHFSGLKGISAPSARRDHSTD